MIISLFSLALNLCAALVSLHPHWIVSRLQTHQVLKAKLGHTFTIVCQQQRPAAASIIYTEMIEPGSLVISIPTPTCV